MPITKNFQFFRAPPTASYQKVRTRSQTDETIRCKNVFLSISKSYEEKGSEEILLSRSWINELGISNHICLFTHRQKNECNG